MNTQLQKNDVNKIGAIRRRLNSLGKLGQRGVSLLEVMVTMLILAIGILGLVPLIGLSVFNNSYSYDVTSADALARERIESLLNTPSYGVLPYSATQDSVGGKYSVVSQVDDNSISAAVPPGLFRINVSITWTDGDAQSRTLNYSTFKPKL